MMLVANDFVVQWWSVGPLTLTCWNGGVVDIDMLRRWVSRHYHVRGGGTGDRYHIERGHYCQCAGAVAVIV